MLYDPEQLPPIPLPTQTPAPLYNSGLLDEILRKIPALTHKEAQAMLDQFFWVARPMS